MSTGDVKGEWFHMAYTYFYYIKSITFVMYYNKNYKNLKKLYGPFASISNDILLNNMNQF
jgi:hypothetical protein